MALTTSDEIQKQLTVIFGFTGHFEQEVGSILGIGKLSQQQSGALVSQSLQFLNAYNAMLRDYAGCELFSIEFELENLDKRAELYKIMPKAMLFIPGVYKDCHTLLLLLAQEMSLLDNQKAKNTINRLGALYFEVEEALNRQELDTPQKRSVLTNFARRFALKLQGQVIEGKWNRRLVGMKTENLDDKYFDYLTVHIKKEVRWDHAKEIVPITPKYSRPRLNWTIEDQFEFLKYQILPSSMNVITQNTLRLCSNLLQIANTGTVDDTQKMLLIGFINGFRERLKAKNQLGPIQVNTILQNIENCLAEIENAIPTYSAIIDKFCKSGQSAPENGGGDAPTGALINSCIEAIQNDNAQSLYMQYFAAVTRSYLKSTNFTSQSKVRSSDFQGGLYYIQESAKLVLQNIKRSLPKFFQYYLLMTYAEKLIEQLYQEFKNQRKPVMALGNKYIEKFSTYLNNQIEYLNYFSESGKNSEKYKKDASESDEGKKQKEEKDSSASIIDIRLTKSQGECFSYFQDIARTLIEPFNKDIDIQIEDLMGFVEIILADIPEIEVHIDRLKKFRSEVETLWSMILRYSTINRLLKDMPTDTDVEPLQFAQNFIEIFRKRLGGFHLFWTNHVVQWITDFGNNVQGQYLIDKDKKKKWSNQRVVTEFIDYINKRYEDETSLKGFKHALKKYVDQLVMNIQNRNLVEIYSSYEESLDFIGQFPDFVRQTFLKVIESLNEDIGSRDFAKFMGEIPDFNQMIEGTGKTAEEFKLESLSRPLEKEKDNQKRVIASFKKSPFIEYLLNVEMKYFAKLIAKPMIITLSSLDTQNFEGNTLFHQIEFKHWDKFMRAYLRSNYLTAKPQFQSGGKK